MLNTEAMANFIAEGVRAAGGEAELLGPGDFSAGRFSAYSAVAFGCPAMGRCIQTYDVTKVMARRKDIGHGEMLYYGDGYVTAWFMWQLQGDQDAAKAFVGDGAEILTNPLYQDQLTAIGP